MDSDEKVKEWLLLNPWFAMRQEEEEFEKKRKEDKRKCRPFKFRPIKYDVPTTDYRIRDVDFFLEKKKRRVYYRTNNKKIVVRILKKKTGNRWKSFKIEDVEFFYRWIYQKNQRPVLLLYL